MMADRRRGRVGGLLAGALLLFAACDDAHRDELPPLTAHRSVTSKRTVITPPASNTPRAYALPYRTQRGSVYYGSDTLRALGDLATTIDRVDERLSNWATGRSPETDLPASFVYLCRDIETLLAIERHHDFKSVYGHADSASTPDRTFEPRGGYYQQLGVIALLDQPGVDVPWNIAHETSHAALARWTSFVPDVLNEGLAEIVTAWVLYSNAEMPSDDLPLDLNVVNTCRSATRRDRRAFRLAWLFGLDYWQFRDDRSDDLNFSLATSLCHFLLSDGHPSVAGRFPALIQRLGADRSPWFAFQRTYPVGLVERRWRDHLDRWNDLPWRVGFGRRWIQHGSHLSARRPARGSTALIWQGDLQPPSRVEFSLAQLPTASTVAFLTSYRSPRHFTVLGARRRGRELIRVDYREGSWDTPALWQLPDHLDPTGVWRLERSPATGEMSWSIDGETVWSAPGSAVDPGRWGLYFESRQASDRTGTSSVTFENVTVE